MKRDDKKASTRVTAKEEGEMRGTKGEKEEGRGKKEGREGWSSEGGGSAVHPNPMLTWRDLSRVCSLLSLP